MINVKYGIVKDLNTRVRHGIIAKIANVTIEENGQKEEDAALFLCKRSFGYGRTTLILRQNLHGVLDPVTLLQIAADACIRLFGTYQSDVAHAITDILLDHVDELTMHPPEDVMIERQRQEKLIEQSGLLVKADGHTILDAR